MSVFIDCMDVPKTCGECPFLCGYLKTWCWLSEKNLYSDRIDLQAEKHKDCPIKPGKKGFIFKTLCGIAVLFGFVKHKKGKTDGKK